jgi:hypothetical protein
VRRSLGRPRSSSVAQNASALFRCLADLLAAAAALEVLVHRWQIDPDIAGATFMAAGGSAPELFTSFIGTFNQSAVGFGTIVGSAVFNVLFVIGTCAVASEDTLYLTWWPLARDCSYYCMSLLTLAMLFGKLSMKPTGEGDAWVKHENFCYWKEDGEFAKPQDCAAIYHWEAGLLFSMCVRVLPPALAPCVTCTASYEMHPLCGFVQVLRLLPGDGIQPHPRREAR